MSRPDPAGGPDDRRGRKAALVIAGTALAWVLFGLIAEKEGFSQSTRLVVDLIAGAGFLFAFWLIFLIWRDRQNDDL